MLTSIRAKLRMMLFFLSIIIALTFLNFLMNQRVLKLERDYAEVIAINNHFAENLAGEHNSLANPGTFSARLRNFCSLILGIPSMGDSWDSVP